MADQKNKTVKVKKSGSFLKETIIELKKVVWPTKKQAAVYTAVTIFGAIFMSLLLTGFDTVLASIEKILLK